jgi:hypothetical protein
MKAVRSFETHQNTKRCRNKQDHNVTGHGRENFKSDNLLFAGFFGFPTAAQINTNFCTLPPKPRDLGNHILQTETILLGHG